MYDVLSLLNSNENFDYGGFRLLQEEAEIMQSQSRLFVFRFDTPGTYTFYMSDDVNNIFYVVVQSDSSICPSVGPFFPANSQYMTIIGTPRQGNLFIEPDWLAIGMLLLFGLLIMLLITILLMLFRKYGWTKLLYDNPLYRIINNYFNIDIVVSKGSRKEDVVIPDDIDNTEDSVV